MKLMNSTISITRIIRSFPLAFLLAASAAQGEGMNLVTLNFESEALDLDSGVVTTTDIMAEGGGADIRIAYNALRSPSAVVMPDAMSGVELAFVADVAFDGVSAETAAELTFSTQAVDAPFSANDTVVVRTNSGALFKLGNALESDTGITFNYVAL